MAKKSRNIILFLSGPEIPCPEQDTLPSIFSEFCLLLYPNNSNNYHTFEREVNVCKLSVSVSISVMRETSDLMGKCGDGSPPSEAHEGGWEGLGKDRKAFVFEAGIDYYKKCNIT